MGTAWRRRSPWPRCWRSWACGHARPHSARGPTDIRAATRGGGRGSGRRDGGRGGGGGGGGEELAHEDWQAWAQRGSTVCAAVYGRAYHKLLLNLRALHPALEDLVLVDAYGKVIGRPGLDLQRR